MGLQIGDVAPDFEAETTEGRIRFHEWIGDSWAVLFSHPKDFTPVCTTELGYMARIKPEFDRRNVKIIGLSVDPVDNHKRWSADIAETQGHAPNYPMIGDTDLSVSKKYGMLPATLEGSCDGRTAADNQTVRNVFVVGPDKKIKLVLIYPMTTGRNFDEVLRVIDSLQLTAKHKVATPAQLEAGRRRHHRRLGLRRRGEDEVSRRLEGATPLAADRAAAQIADACAYTATGADRPGEPERRRGRRAGLYPIDPPVEPMLAKLATRASRGRGCALRAEVGRLPRHRLSRRGRRLHPEPRAAGRSNRYFPEVHEAVLAQLPDRLRGRRRDRHRHRPRAGLRRAADAPAPGRSRDREAGAGDARIVRRVRPAGRRRPDLRDAAAGRPARAARTAAAPASRPRSTSRRSPATAPQAAEWLQRFEGAGPRRRHRQGRVGCPISRASARCSRSSTSAPPTASSPASAGTRPAVALVGSLLLGLYDDNGTLHHVGVTSSFTMARRRELAEELAPLRENALDAHPWREWAAAAGDGHDADARRPEPLERRQGPVVGAAAHRAGLRSEVRPPAGRPLPPRARRSCAGGPTRARPSAATTSSRSRRRSSWRKCSGREVTNRESSWLPVRRRLRFRASSPVHVRRSRSPVRPASSTLVHRSGAVCSGVVTPGGSSMTLMLRKWISAPSDSRQK